MQSLVLAIFLVLLVQGVLNDSAKPNRTDDEVNQGGSRNRPMQSSRNGTSKNRPMQSGRNGTSKNQTAPPVRLGAARNRTASPLRHMPPKNPSAARSHDGTVNDPEDSQILTCELSKVMGIPLEFLYCGDSDNVTETSQAGNGTNVTMTWKLVVEDPDMFERVRIAARMTPRLSRVIDEDPLTYYDLKVKFAYRFILRNQSCNFTEYSLLMPRFWQEYFVGTGDAEEQEQFGYEFWNVSVKFDMNASNATILGHCHRQNRVDNCTVQKVQQLVRERDLCFSGGLEECSSVTHTCVCLTSHGTKTVRVDHTTGIPDPDGTACFVREGHQCLVRHYGTGDLKLPCAYKYMCDPYTGNCHRKEVDY